MHILPLGDDVILHLILTLALHRIVTRRSFYLRAVIQFVALSFFMLRVELVLKR